MAYSPPSPGPSTFKATPRDDERHRWKLNLGSDTTSGVAPKKDESPSVLDSSEELLGILKGRNSEKHLRGTISWKDSKHLAHKSAISNTAKTPDSEGTALSDGNVNQHPMAPPFKKRLGSKNLLGRDTSTLSRNSVNATNPTPTFNHPACAVAVAAQRAAMQTPQMGMRFLDGTGTDSKQIQTLESVGTGHKLMSQPLIHTPHPSMYYRNLAANSARRLQTPISSVQNRSELNFTDINQSKLPSFRTLDNPRESQAPLSMARPISRNGTVTFQDPFRAQPPSFHALNRQLESSGQETSISSARPSSRNTNVSFQHALRASFPFHEAQGSIPLTYATAPPIAPMALTEALTRFTGSHANRLNTNGSLKHEAPTEHTNMTMHSKAPMLAQLYHAPQPSTNNSRTSTSLPQMRSVIASSNHPNEKPGVSDNILASNPTVVKVKEEEKMQPIVKAQILTTNTTSNRAIPAMASFIAQQVALASLSNSTNTPAYNRGCICKNSKCLKLYCKCFQGGRFCDSHNCRCNDCHNSLQHDGPNGVRRKVIWQTLTRRPDAFLKRPTKKTGEGCACKKTQCLKKYCDCFATGTKCALGKCSCINCSNGKPQAALYRPEPVYIAYGQEALSPHYRVLTMNDYPGKENQSNVVIVHPGEALYRQV